MQKRFSKSLITILVATLFMGLVSLPDSIKASLPGDPISDWIREQKVVLGLDLQGGTQLDYRIDLRNANKRNEDDDPSNDVSINDIIDGVHATIERRVNGLGVSEPNIYTSQVADEEHIIVELAGISDIEEAKNVVGKTIQLEFKEPKTELDEDERSGVEAEAKEALNEIIVANGDFDQVGLGRQTTDGKVVYRKDQTAFESELPNHYKGVLSGLQPDQTNRQVVEGGGEYILGAGGQVTEKKTLNLVQLKSKEIGDRTEEIKEKVRASHILIAYQGAERAPETVTRSQDEAAKLAEDLLNEIKETPDKFTQLATENSDDPGSGSNGGDLDFFERGLMTPAFEDAAFALQAGELAPELVKTDFGYHIIKVTERQEASEETVEEMQYTYSVFVFDITSDPWKATGLDGAHFRYATVTYDQIGSPQVTIEFDSEGATMFEELTERLVGQPIAIFVGGELISSPRVNQKITGGNAVITGGFSLQEALQLANDLNTGAIDAPIILTGQYTISATLGKSALQTSLIAGAIGLLVLTIFMIAYYRVMGIFAVLALLIYSIIMIFLLKTFSLVMTLAGIAGIILSIGMAVDANILIFERTKEELADGKSFMAAMSTGFDRAWSSIRDSNVSSLITCAILYFFGNSIIRGFAIMLAIGILVSMFTAINVTRALLATINGTKIAKNDAMLGVKQPKSK